MRISRSGRTSDIFGDELKKFAEKIPGSDKLHEQRLEEHRDMKGHEHKIGTEEAILDADRKYDSDETGQQLIEKNLREQGVDDDAEKTTEARLNEDKKSHYPHRNPEAHERTGEKRPINALDEEMGDAGDDAKLERYESSSKGKEDRVLDDDVGKQLTNEKTKIKNAFNMKKSRVAKTESVGGDYLRYKDHVNGLNGRLWNGARMLQTAAKLDDAMAKIMKSASDGNRELTDEEKAEIDGLKKRKAELLLPKK